MSTPIQRAEKKSKEVLTTLGIKTKPEAFRLGTIIKGTRGNYPEEFQVVLIETASGVAVRVKFSAWIKMILSHLSYFIASLILLAYWIFPVSWSVASIKIPEVILPQENQLYLCGILFGFFVFFLFMEYLSVQIRIKQVRQRINSHLIGADWEPVEPSFFIDAITVCSPFLWLAWIMTSIITFPLHLNGIELNALLNLYDVELAEFTSAIQLSVALTISVVIGLLAGTKIAAIVNFRQEVDRNQINTEVYENQRVSQAAIAAITGVVLFALFGLTILTVYGTELPIQIVVLSMILTVGAALVGAISREYGKGWPHVIAAAWMFFVLVVLVVLNTDEKAYSWSIIAIFFSMLIPIVLSTQVLLEKYMLERNVSESTWLYNLLPISTLIALFSKANNGITRRIERKEDVMSYFNSRVPMSRISEKGSNAVEIVELYLKIIGYLKEKTDTPNSLIENKEIIKRVSARSNGESEILKQVKEICRVAERLIWDPDYTIVEDYGSELLSYEREVYSSLAG